jgi:hypothetical protein
MHFPTVKHVPHASQVRAITLALMKLSKPRQREMFALAVQYLHRQVGPQVGGLHDFITAEPDEILTLEVKDRVLGVIAKAIREDDAAALEP